MSLASMLASINDGGSNTAAEMRAVITELYGKGHVFVGANNSSPSWLAPPVAQAFYARKFVIPEEGILESVGVYIQQTVANVWGEIGVSLYTHDTDQPGILIANSMFGGGEASMVLLNTTPTPRWLHIPLGAPIEAAGDYWGVVSWRGDSADIEFGYESGAGAGVSGIMTSGGQWWVEKGASGAGWSTTGNHEYMIRGLFTPGSIA